MSGRHCSFSILRLPRCYSRGRILKVSRWSNVFGESAIHEILRQVSEYISVDPDVSTAEFEDELRRLRKVVGMLSEVVEGLDPEFFPQGLLDQISNHLRHQNFLQALQTYASNPQLGYIQAANNHITQYAPQIYQLAAMSRPQEVHSVIRSVEKSYESLSNSMDEEVERLRKQIEDRALEVHQMKSALEELTVGVKELESSTDEKLADWQADFAQRQATRSEEFSNAQIDRAKEFERLSVEWKSSVKELTDKIVEKYSSQLGDIDSTFRAFSEEKIEDIKEKHQSILELHQLVGNDSVTGGYKKTADDEKSAADRWRIISMVALVLAVIWLGVKYKVGFVSPAVNVVDWSKVLTAGSLTAILLIAAGYASKQSKMHRDNEKRMRWFELETKALDPFISSLSEADQTKIKYQLIPRMFGKNAEEVAVVSNLADDDTLKTVVQQIAEGVGAVLKKNS